jgi:hypothetical protein
MKTNQISISEKISNYNNQRNELKRMYHGYWFNESHEGFLAIDKDGERMSDWKFYGEEFSEENLVKMISDYPNASDIIFSTRLNEVSDENENEAGCALEHSIMIFNIHSK